MLLDSLVHVNGKRVKSLKVLMGPKWRLCEVVGGNVLCGMHASDWCHLPLKYIILCANHNLMNLETLPVKVTYTCLCACGHVCMASGPLRGRLMHRRGDRPSPHLVICKLGSS